MLGEEEYTSDIRHVAGIKNFVADTLKANTHRLYTVAVRCPIARLGGGLADGHLLSFFTAVNLFTCLCGGRCKSTTRVCGCPSMAVTAATGRAVDLAKSHFLQRGVSISFMIFYYLCLHESIFKYLCGNTYTFINIYYTYNVYGFITMGWWGAGVSLHTSRYNVYSNYARKDK
jgi:hypothetical protein